MFKFRENNFLNITIISDLNLQHWNLRYDNLKINYTK